MNSRRSKLRYYATTLLRSTFGFTLAELLIIVGIIVLMTSLLVLNNRTGQKQIILYREQAHFVEEILRARSLAIQKFADPNVFICAYGLRILDPSSFVLFKNLPRADKTCGTPAYGNLSEDVESFMLDPSVQFDTNPGFTEVAFLPPDPKVYFNGSLAIGEEEVDLKLPATGRTVKIKINAGGQIVTE